MRIALTHLFLRRPLMETHGNFHAPSVQFFLDGTTSAASLRFDMKTRLISILLLGILLPMAATAAEITVFAAASLSDSLRAISPLYAKATGDTLRFNFGASGTLTRQIEEGAPADLFFSADELRVDQLATDGLLVPGTRRTVLANTLVLVIPAGQSGPASFAALAAANVRRIAIGIPATVPAGTYAAAYLKKLNLWEPLRPKLVPLDNVRAVLAAVESGDADAGIVYKTDALISKKITIIAEVPALDGPSITYPVAVIKTVRSVAAASRLAIWLAGSEAQSVFAKYGFLPPK